MTDRLPLVDVSGVVKEVSTTDTLFATIIKAGTLSLKNVAGTFVNSFTNTTTAARTWTLQDKDYTLAGLDDILTKALTGLSASAGTLTSSDTILGAFNKISGLIDNSGWTSWTPTWTNITIGNATVDGAYKKIGKTVFARLDVTFGSTSSAVTTAGTLHSFTLPVNAKSRNAYAILGRGHGATSDSFNLVAQYKSTSDVYIGYINPQSGYVKSTFDPVGWQDTYVLTLEFCYEAA